MVLARFVLVLPLLAGCTLSATGAKPRIDGGGTPDFIFDTGPDFAGADPGADLSTTTSVDLAMAADVDLASTDMAADPCIARARLIYVVDQNNTLRSFEPKTLTFNTIGSLNCPAQIGATPFSMAVDRDAVAWVLYSSGEVFNVSTQNAACGKTGFTATSAYTNFGMGFVADVPGSRNEHLYVASSTSGLGGNTLGVMDPITLKITTVGNLSGSPELTGTADSTLWGFYPDATSPRVAQIDKNTAAEGMSFPLSALKGTPLAWAFAFWGGDFWIFLKRDTDASTHVYQLDKATGQVADVLPSTGFTIVGAGVSICAPLQ
jgi:hypothetical protein